MTEDEFNAHVNDPINAQYLTITIKCYHSTGTVRFSDRGFNPYDTNTPFHAFIVKDGLPVLEYSIFDNVSVGDFSIKVKEGIDNHLYKNLEFQGNQCEICLGDNRWVNSSDDFRVVATALINDVNYRGNGKYDFELSDYGYKLEEPVQPTKTASGQNKILSYGVARNVKPQVVDEFNLIMQFHDGDATGYAITVFDMRLDVTANVNINYATGTFQFTAGHNPTALENIRVDITAVKQTAFDIIQDVATRNSLGTVSKTGFGTLQNNAIHSVVVRDNETMNSLFERIMSSIGGYHTLDNFGNVKLVYGDLTGTPDYALNKDNSTKLEQNGSINALTKLTVKYNKNHDPHTDSELDNTLTEAQKKPFIDEYSVIEKTTTANQGVLEEFQEYITTLANQTDAQSFADAKAIYRAVKRIIYSTQAGPYSDRFEPGNLIKIKQDDFDGVAMLTRLKQNAGRTLNEIEVLE